MWNFSIESTSRFAVHTEQGTIDGGQITEQVAYVPPDDYLFSGTILENIMMSESEPQMEKINMAASDANILMCYNDTNIM